jgi:hypothetical protein
LQPPQTDYRPTWTRLTQVYFALLAVRLVLYVFQYGSPDDVAAQPTFKAAMAYGQVSLVLAGVVLGLFWLHRAWARVPSPHRLSFNGRRVEPRQAALRLLIPIYNFYWLFVANWGLTTAIDRQLAASTPKRALAAPSTFALVCCIVQLVPLVNLIASPFFWAAFMVLVDAVQAEAEQPPK